ncbi:chaperone protein DNAJ, putative [Trypanosoma brucei brucei TREU927]|uniref:Chaperone protein DNAJ, putative n=1 Tax=Trypanosoma brucei brucei (strain 927/4 GUTat10.1) TaxID=185431 RepID=Q584Q8_TRYB2|nr:chaperone protein DNAJ, putative [Trypanosoma brucei brucei TREU927]AAX80880.1 chaperone protein DNAJ, putative [Trypanosoma brucei]AAZ11810.1 chaperone protein DNAJ, putative [Trypanosoma brucei brucei TREU927]
MYVFRFHISSFHSFLVNFLQPSRGVGEPSRLLDHLETHPSYMRRVTSTAVHRTVSSVLSPALLPSFNGTLLLSVCFASCSAAPVRNLYKRLGLDHKATSEEVKAAYRQRALECHPDVVDDNRKAQAEVDFRAVSEAYDVLIDPQKRKEHDKALGLERTVPPAKKQQEGEGVGCDSKGSFNRGVTRPRNRKPFVRGDADRNFREAFHGMSLDQVLFRERLRQRRMQKQMEEKAKEGDDGSPAGREESIRRVAAAAAERFAEKVRRQYGPGMLRHARVYTSLSRDPQPPPSDYMPFRPFHGWTVPNGVRTPPEPTLGPTAKVEDVKDVQLAEPAVGDASHQRKLPKHFPVVQAPDGSSLLREEAIACMERERRLPHNMGKLYSYHRPY